MKTLTRKKIILLALGVVLVIITCVFAFSSDDQGEGSDPAKKIVSSGSKTDSISIDNLSDFTDWLNVIDFTETEKTLYERVKTYESNAPSNLTGTIRQSSFSTKYGNYDDGESVEKIPVVEFIVDIPEVKQSYVVNQAGGDDYAYSIVYVVCPDAKQLKYGDFGCVNKN